MHQHRGADGQGGGQVQPRLHTRGEHFDAKQSRCRFSRNQDIQKSASDKETANDRGKKNYQKEKKT